MGLGKRWCQVEMLLLGAAGVLLVAAHARAEPFCNATPLVSGLRTPLGITRSNLGNLMVAETGSLGVLHSGRISIVDRRGTRRTLIDGLPSGTNDVNEPSGPAGLVMRGRTLYVAIGIGDAIHPGPFPGSSLANPNPSSPIFSSVLAIEFSAHLEMTSDGFSLTFADQLALADGERVRLSNRRGDRLVLELVADFPDYVAEPRPDLPQNVRGSNPFDLVVDQHWVYVSDGARNHIWQAALQSGRFRPLASFEPTPNPLFPGFGGPVVEAVPTGVAQQDGRLLVALFRGFPFPAGTSAVERTSASTGRHSPFITERTSAIDVLPLSLRHRDDDDDEHDDRERAWTGVLVLQHASGDLLSGPGSLVQVDRRTNEATTRSNCLNRPASMARDPSTGRVYITEITDGRVVVIR
jgi:hypothetical protein